MSCWCVRAFRSRVLCSPPLQCAIASTAVALEGEPQRPLPSPTPAQVWFLKENRNIPPPSPAQVWSLVDNSIVATIQGHKKPITHMKLMGVYLYTSGGRKVRGGRIHT